MSFGLAEGKLNSTDLDSCQQPHFTRIKHGSFPSLCTVENHGTVLELNI